MLMEAAVDAETGVAHITYNALSPSTQGVSENVMLGQMAPAGTGSFDLFLNNPMLQQHAIEDVVKRVCVCVCLCGCVCA